MNQERNIVRALRRFAFGMLNEVAEEFLAVYGTHLAEKARENFVSKRESSNIVNRFLEGLPFS
jgi:hypothetical protein